MSKPSKPPASKARLLTRFSFVILFVTGWQTLFGTESVLFADERHPNVLLICVDDLRPELKCFGVDYIHSPNIDRLATTGRLFHRHYVQAPTCGASRYALLTGNYGGANNLALFERAKDLKQDRTSVSPSMPAWFRSHGYTTVSVGKVSHHPGGRGGSDWDDAEQLEVPDSWDRHLLPAGLWKHPRGWMHGLANGEIRVGPKQKGGAISMHLLQAVDGPDSIYPDGGSIDEALNQMDLLNSNEDQPFFLAVGILRPHLPFGAPAKYLQRYVDAKLPPTPHPQKPADKTTWHRSGEFMKYHRGANGDVDPNTDAEYAIEVRKHYAACVSYADAQVGKLLEKLATTGADKNTIVVLWGDHGWHLGEHAIWGKHSLFEESLRSPLIITYPGVKLAGESTTSIVESVDIFPTLCDLADVAKPETVTGISLRPILENPKASGNNAFGYYRKAETLRTNTHRLILHHDGHVELYDHTSDAKESVNVAKGNPDLVESLSKELKKKIEAMQSH